MVSLLTDEMFEQIGVERIQSLSRELGKHFNDQEPYCAEGLVRDICMENVQRFFALTGAGLPLPSFIAGLTMASIRLGYAIRDDEIERDRAAVAALTEGE